MGVFLPPEIIGRIIWFLQSGRSDSWKPFAQESLVPYVTISRVWQAEVERKTFSRINLTRDYLAAAAEILTPIRRLLVREVHVDVILPSYDDAASLKEETEEEEERNNTIFAHDVRDTLQLLAQWEEPCRIHLAFDVFSHSDPARNGQPDDRLSPRAKRRAQGALLYSFFEIRNSCLRLPRVDHRLPAIVCCVKSLTIPQTREYGPEARRIDPAAACLIASRCSNLRALDIRVHDTKDWDIQGRSQSRQGKTIYLSRELL